MIELRARIVEVRDRVESALSRVGRTAGSVLIVAVSKTFPAETVVEATRAGLSVFGENRIQEAAAKIPRVAEILGRRDLSWHLVGHLQSNKAKQAAPLFNLVHSVDGDGLAHRLDAAAAAARKRQAVLIQVNVAGEGTKSGVSPAELRRLVDLVSDCQSLELRGLMAIPPYDPDPGRSRPHFTALRSLGEKVAQWVAPAAYRADLSMGMTEDFEVAIEEGATIIRVGRALFGERPA